MIFFFQIYTKADFSGHNFLIILTSSILLFFLNKIGVFLSLLLQLLQS